MMMNHDPTMLSTICSATATAYVLVVVYTCMFVLLMCANTLFTSDAPVFFIAPQEIQMWRGRRLDIYETDQMRNWVKCIQLHYQSKEERNWGTLAAIAGRRSTSRAAALRSSPRRSRSRPRGQRPTRSSGLLRPPPLAVRPGQHKSRCGGPLRPPPCVAQGAHQTRRFGGLLPRLA